MPRTLLRLGLWLILAVLALHVLHETFPTASNLQFVTPDLLARAGILGGVLAAAGVVTNVLGKAKPRVMPASRCAVCRIAIKPGTIYCRDHLRSLLSDEHDRRHFPRTTR